MGMIYGSMGHTISGRKKKVTRRKAKVYARGVPENSSQPYRERHPTTQAAPVQLELPLEWNRHVTPEPLLKVSEPCISPMPYLL